MPSEPQLSRAAESRAKNRGGNTEGWSPRKRGRLRTKRERLRIRKKGKVKGMKHNNLIALWLLGSR
jgi:hypothetical protein